jgi:hypothetical protein
MQRSQHINRCRVYVHPAATKSLASIEAIQSKTGLLVIFNTKPKPAGSLNAVAWSDHRPWGGDAA